MRSTPVCGGFRIRCRRRSTNPGRNSTQAARPRGRLRWPGSRGGAHIVPRVATATISLSHCPCCRRTGLQPWYPRFVQSDLVSNDNNNNNNNNKLITRQFIRRRIAGETTVDTKQWCILSCSTSKMTYIVSGGALNSAHSLTCLHAVWHNVQSPLEILWLRAMCQTLSKRRTDGRRDSSFRPSVCPFIRSFVSVRCVCQWFPSYGGTNRDASYKFTGEIKIRDQQ